MPVTRRPVSSGNASSGSAATTSGSITSDSAEAESIEVKAPDNPDDVQRHDVARVAAEKLLDVVTQFKDVKGTGQESAAKGDPRITERRNALSTLIAEKSGQGTVGLAALEAMSPHVKEDIKWLMAADRRDYAIDGGQDQFNWAKSDMSGPRKIKKEFDKRVKLARAEATAVGDESKSYLDVSNNSVIGLSFISDPELRAESMMDVLLQFRARTDKANQTEVTWGDNVTRMDLIAPVLVAEQRILLAAADLASDDPSKLREYALLREVIASHPTSSVNGIFDARNAVGKLFMDGNNNYSSRTHAMAWIKEEVAPGATTSAYKAIHHNFSRDTPNNIAATIEAWVFPVGPQARRAELFLTLTDAIQQARAGQGEAVKKRLAELPDVDRESLKNLLAELSQVQPAELAGRIAAFIATHAEKPLAADPHDALKKLADKAKRIGGSRYHYNKDAEIKKIRDEIEGFGEPLATQLTSLKAAIKDVAAEKLGETMLKWLQEHADDKLTGNVEANLGYFARLYRSVCSDQPSIRTLEKDLFKAGAAWPEVADVIAQIRAGNDLGTLKDLGEARLAMRDAIIGANTGFERHELIKFDAQLSRLTCTELGAAVDRVAELKTDPQKAEALIAVQTALRSAVASGLHAIKDNQDPAASLGKGLDQVLAQVDAAIAAGRIDAEGYRGLMAEVKVAVARSVQNIRAFVDARAVDVAAAGVELDPQFLDQFIKQSPLHYATALAEKGMRAGLKEEIGPRRIANIEGMRVLNSVGPVVFEHVVFANNTKDLVRLKPPKDALSILYKLEEKKMVAVGGLITDTKNAPGGNSHLNMYAMNNGIPVLALPELQTKYAEFFANAASEGGIYVDDSDGQFAMMTVAYAREQGLLDDDKIKALRPGTNKRIKYLKPASTLDTFELIATHESIFSPTRKTREIELYVPVDEVQGVGRQCTPFDDLAKLGIQARHLAGEKGTVLALLRNNPKLRKYVPDGSEITTGRVRGLLTECGLDKDWDKIWQADPKVGVVDDSNFGDSAFYTDADYRASAREHLQTVTLQKLQAHLLGSDGGRPALTAAGQKLYDELMANESLAQSHTGSIILRSSFTGEDRPGKSGAGQYESFVDRSIANELYGKAETTKMFKRYEKAQSQLDEALKHVEESPGPEADKALARAQKRFDKVRAAHIAFMGPARVQAAIGVIESAWMPEPIENNVADDVNLQHIACSVVVQDCLTPTVSGVMISRDTEHGTRNQVTYQLVKGFGGGVEGGKAEEGVLSASGHRVKIEYPGEPGGLVGANKLAELREIVLEVERYFNEVIEKGQGHAVDMEVAMQDGEWKIVQARVILMDK